MDSWLRRLYGRLTSRQAARELPTSSLARFASRFELMLNRLKKLAPRIGLYAIFSASIAYQLSKVVQVHGGDFRCLWIAGLVWRQGLNPYSSDFDALYQLNFGAMSPADWWVYPPQWYPIVVLFSFLPFKSALLSWSLLSIACLISGSWLVAKAFETSHNGSHKLLFVLGTIFVCSMDATAGSIVLGQTSSLIYFGMSLLLYGLATGAHRWLVAGLVVVALKPNIGAVFFAAILGLAHMRAVATATIVSLAGCIPSFFLLGISANIHGFLRNVGRYGGVKWNAPPELIGLTHLLNWLTGNTVSAIALTLSAASVALVVCLSVGATRRDQALFAVIACIGMFLFILPLHGYDMLLIVPVALLALIIEHPSRWLICIGTLITLRSGNIALISGIRNPATSVFLGSSLTSIAGLLIFIAALWIAVDLRLGKIGNCVNACP